MYLGKHRQEGLLHCHVHPKDCTRDCSCSLLCILGLARGKWLLSMSTAGSHQLQSRADEFHCRFVFSSFTFLLCSSSFCHREKLCPLGQQQAALSHGSHSGSSGHLGLSRHCYKSMKKQMLLVSPKFIPKRQTKSRAM